MAKLIPIILLILFAMSCIGCTEKIQTDVDNSEGNQTLASTSVQPVIKEHTLDDDIKVTVLKTTFLNKLKTADPGCFFVIATIEMNNTGNTTYNINPNMWALEWDGMMYSPDIPATYADGINHPQTIADNELLVSPGGHKIFQIVYQLQSALSTEPNPEYSIVYLGE